MDQIELKNSALNLYIESELLKINNSINNNLPINNDLGVYTGIGGYLLFFCQNFLKTKDHQYLRSINELVLKSIEIIENSTQTDFSYASGIAGWGWAIQHLSDKNLLDFDVSDLLNDLDSIIYKKMLSDIADNNFDHLYGALGLGKYFLKRNKKSEVTTLLNYLNKTKCVSGKTISWINFNKNKHVEEYNFSLSHGITGIIYFLSKCIESDISVNTCKMLIKGAVEFMYQNIISDEEGPFYFPSSLELHRDEKTKIIYDTRLAWCYGDLGIFYILYNTAAILSDTELKERATKYLLKLTFRKDFKETKIIDHGFCHGTIGAAYIFLKMWTKTNHPLFLETAQYWLNKTFEDNLNFPGVEGYKYLLGNFEQRKFQTSSILLEGNIALSLVYLNYLNQELTHDWDEAMMLD